MITEHLHETIIILDFGSQYTQLIARKIRELNVFSEIHPYNVSLEILQSEKVKGVILSGSPSSIYEKNVPKISSKILDMDIPILGICYGLQLLMHLNKGKVNPAEKKEYGQAQLQINSQSKIFEGIPDNSTVWMSHGDKVDEIPIEFESIAQTNNSPFAAVHHKTKPIWGIQFHPEVTHTIYGKKLLKNFCYKICQCKGDWSSHSFIDESIKSIRQAVGKEKVICGLSGGVDSSVTAILLNKAIGTQLHCIFVDTGLLRLNEAELVEKYLKNIFKYR